MLLLAVFGLASSLWAADPSVGTWKANIAKSKITPSTETLPKEAMIVVREVGADEFELAFSSTEANGSQTSLKVTWPLLRGALIQGHDDGLSQDQGVQTSCFSSAVFKIGAAPSVPI